jgi:hypothetical protein
MRALKPFRLNRFKFMAQQMTEGVLINPELPKGFDNTSNEARPKSQRKWWNMPYIETYSDKDNEAYLASRTDEYAEEMRIKWANKDRESWFKKWPSGVRYDVRCLDGGAWDRSTNWGMFATLDEALSCAKSGPAWRRI